MCLFRVLKVKLSKWDVLADCLFGFNRYFSFKNAFDVWVMKEYGVKDSWVRFIVNQEPLRWAIPSKSGKLLLRKGKRISFYDPETGEVVELTTKGVCDDDIECEIYQASLIHLQE